VTATGARLVITPGIIAALSRDGDIDSRLTAVMEFHGRHHNPGGRISVGFGPHSVYDLSPEQCGRIAAAAAERDAVVHIHLEETRAERTLVEERHGRSATRILAEAGLFDATVVAAHGVWLDAADRAILAEANASVAHCPVSNLKLGSGIAPVAELLADGVNVGLATDGPASNDSLDLWEELKLAPLLARGVNNDPQAMSAATALSLATTGAATAIGLDDVGHLSPGAWADVIRIDLDHPAFHPLEDLLAQLVFAGSSRFVTDVWVGGDQVVVDGAVRGVDRQAVLAEISARGRRLAGDT
jgi:5-methylthioadenosine/S-adenosylhomocysteine deaminase